MSKQGIPNQQAPHFQVMIHRDHLLICGFQGYLGDDPFCSQSEGGKSIEHILREVAVGLAGS